MVSQDIYIHNSSTLSGFFDIRGNHYCISVVQYVSCRGLNCPFLVEHLPLTFACFFFVFFLSFQLSNFVTRLFDLSIKYDRLFC